MLQKFALAEMPAAEPEQVMALEWLRLAVLRRVDSKPVEAEIPTFDAEISMDVDLSRLDLLVSEPERDHRSVDSCAEQSHRRRVTQSVKCHFFAVQ